MKRLQRTCARYSKTNKTACIMYAAFENGICIPSHKSTIENSLLIRNWERNQIKCGVYEKAKLSTWIYCRENELKFLFIYVDCNEKLCSTGTTN